jgi:nuclear transport factor 2 (NTF2) superfamily protein
MSRPPLPPFALESAIQKVRLAEDAWNGRGAARVALADTRDSRWCDRSPCLQGRTAIEAFLKQKWQRERDYRLVKEQWAFREDRVAVRCANERHDADGQWFRSDGNERRAIGGAGLMHTRIASIDDLAIAESARMHHGPAGRLPDFHAGLTELGL